MSKIFQKASSMPANRGFSVPKNSFRVLDNELEKLPEYSIPLGSRILHPFFIRPNATERTALCINERNPQLFEGKPVLPALVKDATSNKSTLIESRLDFHSVKDIQRWLHSFVSSRNKSSMEVLAGILPEIRRSGFNVVSGVGKEVESFLQENPSMDSQQLDNILSKLLIFPAEPNPIFLDELLLYILQRETLSEQQWLASLQVLPKYIGREIDDVRMLIEILSQWLWVSAKFEVSEEIATLLIQTINATSQKLGEDVVQQFGDEYLNKLLEIYIKVRDFHESSTIIAKLGSRNRAPPVKVVEAYMELVKNYSTFDEVGKILERKFKMANLYGLHPFFRTHLTPIIIDHLLSYCVHPSEVFALFDLITSTSSANKLLDSQLSNIIMSLYRMNDSHVKISLHLSSLYEKLRKSYQGIMPEKYVLDFVTPLASISNFRAIQQILDEQELKDTKPVLHLIKNHSAFKNTFGFTAEDKTNLTNYILHKRAEHFK